MPNILTVTGSESNPDLAQVRTPNELARFQLVPLTLIEVNPFQTRVRFEERDIISLAEDIRRQREFLPDTLGLLQMPKGRRTKGGRVQLVFGHRRLAAFCYLAQRYGGEWLQMPVQIEELDDETMADMAWSENQARSDISAIEKAWALQRVRDQFGYSNSELAQRRGMDFGTMSNLLRLLQLPDEVQAMILRRELHERHGRALVSLLQITKNETVVIELATAAVENKLAAAQLDEKVSDTIHRLTVETEPAVAEFEEWENPLPAGCAPHCSRCEFSTARKRRLYCARPELYQQKYRMWHTRVGQTEEKEADNPASVSLEAEDWAEFTADKEEAIREPVLSIFQCPRCRQEEVTVDRMMRYQCAGCNAKWPTVAGLLQEINIVLAKTINPAMQSNGLLESKLDQTRLQALLAQGVRFSEGQTWNTVPTHKCLGCNVNFEEFKQSLKYRSGEFLPQADGTVTHFCQHLRLFPYFASQFVPNANGAIELKVAEADLNLYPPETVSRTRLRVQGDYSYLLNSIDAYCVDPHARQFGSCLQQLEFEAARAKVKELTAQGTPAVLPDFVREATRKNEFIWLQPQLGGRFCTPISCLHSTDDPAGYVVIAQPDRNWQMACIHETCGRAAQAALIDQEAEQQRQEQQRQQAALANLSRAVVERTLFAPARESLDLSTDLVLAALENLLVPTWDMETMLRVVTGWQQAVRTRLTQEMAIIDPTSKEVTRLLQDQFGDLAERATLDNAHKLFVQLREKLVPSQDELSRWIACLALVRSWRDEVNTVEQIEEAMRKISVL